MLDNDNPVQFPGDYDKLLQQLQGNILKGHGRNYTVNLFLQFSAGAAADDIREELRTLATKYVVSAYDQLAQHDHYHRYGVPGGLFGNLFLTRLAYQKLGFGDRLEAWFGDPPGTDGRPPRRANFVTGMKKAARDFGDEIPNPTEPLERAYLEDRIDALLLLADDSESFLLRTARDEMTRFERGTVVTVVAVERGAVLRNADDAGVEHFGYVDGRSQPLFLASDFRRLTDDGAIDPARSRERISETVDGDLTVWNPFAKLSLVLLKDPAVEDPQAFGSYYVFRKLEQNVRGFLIAEHQLADELGLEGAARERAGAMAVGRFRDGTPLVLSESDGFTPGRANNFRYDGLDESGHPVEGVPTDPFGLKCPFQAHIRKANPRQNADPDRSREENRISARKDQGRRIARRGITYGVRKRPDMLQALDDLPTSGVGLLFACFQSSIMKQFAFVQAQWANNVTFKLTGSADRLTGLDAVIGQDGTSIGARQLGQHWRKEHGGTLAHQPQTLNELRVSESHPTSFRFAGFVKFRGGDFFFAPSLTFLLEKP